jgi:hypothetical protein
MQLTVQIPVNISDYNPLAYGGGDTLPISKAQPELSEIMTHVHDTVEPYILDTENIVRIIDTYFQPTALQESWKYFCENQDTESAQADSHKDIVSEIFKIHVHEDLQYIWPYGPVDLSLSGDRINKFWNHCLKPIGSHEQIVQELQHEFGVTNDTLEKLIMWMHTPEATVKMLQCSSTRHFRADHPVNEEAKLSEKINKLMVLSSYKHGLGEWNSLFHIHRGRFRHPDEPETIQDVHWITKAQVIFEYLEQLQHQ